MENHDSIVPIEIDLNAATNGELNESWLTMFGSGVKMILRRLFGHSSAPVSIIGTRGQVDAFTSALAGEKLYLDSMSKHGLDNPRTYQSNANLEQSIGNFEQETGLKWPFK